MTMDIIVKKEEKTLEKNGGMASVPFYVKKIFFGLTSKVVQFSEKNEDKIAVMRQTVSVTVLFYVHSNYIFAFAFANQGCVISGEKFAGKTRRDMIRFD